MTTTTEGPVPLAKAGFWKRTVAEFINVFTPTEKMWHNGYVPFQLKNPNTLVQTFVKPDVDPKEIKEFPTAVEVMIICHKHRFISKATPTHFGEGMKSIITCPFCPPKAGFVLNLNKRNIVTALSYLDEAWMTNSVARTYLHITGSWLRLRRRYPNYTYRWKMVRGVPVRIDEGE
jgi:hypothetical protein